MTRTRTLLTDEDKGKILAYLEEMSAEKVAEKMERDPTTIQRFIAKYRKTGKIENLPRSGRPPALNNYKKNTLLRKAKKERRNGTPRRRALPPDRGWRSGRENAAVTAIKTPDRPRWRLRRSRVRCRPPQRPPGQRRRLRPSARLGLRPPCGRPRTAPAGP